MQYHTIFSGLIAFSICNTTLFAAEIPLNLDSPNWRTLEYKSIPSNTVLQADNALQIDIKDSASPLIYVFDQPQTFRTIQVKGEIIGNLPKIPTGYQQGEKGADDFAFRIGVVVGGSKTLNFAQKLLAAEWVTTLYNLAPAGEGIDHIQFLNLANPGAVEWEQRVHPLSKGLFIETIVKEIQNNQKFELDYKLAEPVRVLALWISSDGDDTASSYTVKLNNINYQ